MRKNIIFTIFAIIITLLGTACSSSSNNAVPGLNFGKNTIAGQVLNPQGLPVPNAEVQLYPSKEAHKTALAKETLAGTSLAMRMNMVGQEFRTNTNQNGEYSFTNVPDGEYTLLAMAGDALQFVQMGIIANSTRGDTTPINPVLIPTGNAMGKLTLNGNPVKGAVVYLENTDYVAITDQEGTFSFQKIAAGNYELKLLEIPFLEDVNTVIVLETEVVLDIEAASTLELPDISVTTKTTSPFKYLVKGSVKTTVEDEELVAGIVVLAMYTGPVPASSMRGAYYPDSKIELAYGVTNDEGAYQIPLREAGNYVIAPINPPVDLTLDPRVHNVEVKTTNTLATPLMVDGFNLIKGFELKGQFLEYEKNEPLPSVTLMLHTADKNWFKAVKTDNDGKFSLYLASGSYEITCEGYDIVTPKLIEIKDHDITIGIQAAELISKVVGNFTVRMSDPIYEYKLKSIVDKPVWFINDYTKITYETNTNYSGEFEISLPYGVYYCVLLSDFYELEEFRVEIATTSTNLYDKFYLSYANEPKSFELGPVSEVLSVEAAGDNFYVFRKTSANEVVIDMYNVDGDSSPPETKKIKDGVVDNISTLVHNNKLYVLTVDSGANNVLWVYNLNLDLIASYELGEDSGVNELITDGYAIMYLLNDQSFQGETGATTNGFKLKSIVNADADLDIEFETSIKYVVPAIDSSHIYYPRISWVNLGGEEPEENLEIVRRDRYNGDEAVVASSAISVFDDEDEETKIGGSDIVACDLHLESEHGWVRILLQIKDEEGYRSTDIDILSAEEELLFTNALSVEDLDDYYAPFATPEGAKDFQSIFGINYLEKIKRISLDGVDKILGQIKNPYVLAGNKTYVFGEYEGRLRVYVVTNNCWEPIVEDIIVH